MTWEEAQDFCDSQSTSQLVEIQTEAMQNYVSREKDDKKTYWIGARDIVVR